MLLALLVLPNFSAVMPNIYQRTQMGGDIQRFRLDLRRDKWEEPHCWQFHPFLAWLLQANT